MTASPRRSVPFAAKLARKICDEVSAGQSLQEVCQQPGMPDERSFRRWVVARPEVRAEYDAARRLWADAVADDLCRLAASAGEVVAEAARQGVNENAAIAGLRLEVDTKKWLLSKFSPRIYGDRLAAEITGAGGADLIPAEFDSSKAALLILNMLHAARPKDAELQPAIEAEAAPIKHLEIELAPDPRYAIPSRTVLHSAVYDGERDRRRQEQEEANARELDRRRELQDASVSRERVRLRLVQFGDISAGNRLRNYDEPRGGR
jgi:hypothetical protein